MHCKIDWLAFTMPLPGKTRASDRGTVEFMLALLAEYVGASALKSLSLEGGEVIAAKRFYACLLVSPVTSARVSWGDVNEHLFVELTSKAIDCLTADDTFVHLLNIVSERVSRIDLACDIETDTYPAGFLKEASIHAKASRASFNSNEGLSEYVGSRKNERFMRVYRYRAPHPRSPFLRVEHELKGDLAKVAASEVLSSGIVATFLRASNQYKFSHECWKPELAIEGKISYLEDKRNSAGSVLWILEQVTPAIVNAHRQALFDANAWFLTEVKPRL